MGISRRGFLGCVAGSLTAGLPLDRPRPVATRPRRVLLDLREQCALPESLSGYESALAGLGASVTRADARAASGCALLIVPAALALRAAAVRAIVTCLGAGATVIIESGAGFATDRDFAAHRVALRDHLRLHIEAPVGLWSAAPGSQGGAIPYVDYTWPSPAKVRDFSRVVPLGRREEERDIIAWVNGLPVALRRRCGRGDLIFLGSPLGPALRAGDAEARRWLSLTV